MRLLLGIAVRDATAGFRLFRRTTLEKIDLGLGRSRTGYVFQTDMVARCLRGRADRARGADRVRRAGARRLQDERRGGHRVAARGSPRWGLRERRDQVRRALAAAMSASRSRARLRRRSLRLVLFALFIVVPLVEIYVIIQVGQVIGAWWTILLLIVDSILGTWLIRREGGRAWRALRDGAATAAGCRPASSPTAR